MTDHVLTNTELVVITLSQNDSASSLVERSSVFELLFGRRTEQPLADTRLEDLRRYAILRRVHGDALGEGEHQRLREAGYDDRRIAEINNLIAEHSMRRGRFAQAHETPIPSDFHKSSPSSFRPTLATSFELQTESVVMPNILIKYAQKIALFTLLAGLSMSVVAHAQDNYGSDIPVETTSQNHITIGAGAAVLPEFQGSEDYFIQPIPIVDIKQGPFFLNLGDGLGINVIDSSHFRAGVSVTPVVGYDADKVPAGIGKLGISAGARGFVSGTIGGVVATLSATVPFTGDAKGMIAEAEISYPVQVTDRLSIVPGLNTTWADKKYLRRYYGVNAEQAAASGLPGYQPSSGFQDIGASLAMNYRLTDHFSIVGAALVTYNLDPVMDSPFAARRWQPGGILGVSYTF